MAQQIKIIKVPQGQAPEWVREAEVGLKLTVVNLPDNSFFWQTWATGLLDWKRIVEAEDPFYGYNVKTTEFMHALENQSPIAARWFKEMIDPKAIPWLIFRKDECQLL